MATILSFDEINSLAREKKEKSIPYSEYFGAMGISEKEKENRIRLAERLEGIFFFILSYLYLNMQQLPIESLTGDVRERILDEMWGDIQRISEDFGTMNSDILTQIIALSGLYIDATLRNFKPNSPQNTAYWISEDRARYNAENMSNFLRNSFEFFEATEKGNAKKTWHTMADNRVRETHVPLNGTTIPIDHLFTVGESLMRYPKDASLGASADEIANCRCWLTYS